MSRIVDEPYFTYSAYNALTSGIQVKCPKCHGAGVVTADDDNAYFRCLSCGHRMTQDRTIYRYDVHNQCKNCGRYYRVDIEDTAKQHFPVLHVTCPYCGTTMSGEVHKTAEAFSYIGEIRDGREPYFGLELCFLTSFQGKPVWALNREHLAYLIGYLSADLREDVYKRQVYFSGLYENGLLKGVAPKDFCCWRYWGKSSTACFLGGIRLLSLIHI